MLFYAFKVLVLPGGSVVKNPPDDAGNMGSIPESGRSPGEGNGSLLQYSCLENPTNRGAWRARATVQGFAQSWTPCQSCNTELYISVFFICRHTLLQIVLLFPYSLCICWYMITSQFCPRVTSLFSSNRVSVKSLTCPSRHFYLRWIWRCCLLSVICKL